MKRLFALALVVSWAMAPGYGYCVDGQLHADGYGTACAFPDRVRLVFTISGAGDNRSAAVSACAAEYEATAQLLATYGIDRTKIATGSYQIQDRYAQDERDGRRVKDGFNAVHVIRFVLADLAKIGPVVEAMSKSGTNKLGGMEFQSSALEQLRDAALFAAVKRAHANAAIMASAEGGALGELVELVPAGDYGRPIDQTIETLGAAPTTITPDSLRISVLVSGKWAFRPGVENR